MNPFPYLNTQTGLIEIIDPLTGNVLAIQSTHDFTPGNNPTLDPTKSIIVQTANGPVELQAGPAAELYAQAHDKIPTRWKYSTTLAHLVADEIARGGKLTKLPPTYPPYTTLARWRREIPEFRQILEDATRDRAEHFHDHVFEELETMHESSSDDRAAVARTAIDSMKWLAQVNNNDRYGNKTKISGDPAAPLQIILDTGIRRDEPLPVMPQESEKTLNLDPKIEELPPSKPQLSPMEAGGEDQPSQNETNGDQLQLFEPEGF